MHQTFYLNDNFSNQNYPVNGPALMLYVFINCITNWEACSRQSCYAAGHSSAECASEKASLMRIVFRKLILKDASACKFPQVCKSGSTVCSVTIGPNPSRTHGIFFLFIQFDIIHYVDQEYLAHTTDKRKMLAIRLALCMKHFLQMIMIRTKILP